MIGVSSAEVNHSELTPNTAVLEASGLSDRFTWVQHSLPLPNPPEPLLYCFIRPPGCLYLRSAVVRVARTTHVQVQLKLARSELPQVQLWFKGGWQTWTFLNSSETTLKLCLLMYDSSQCLGLVQQFWSHPKHCCTWGVRPFRWVYLSSARFASAKPTWSSRVCVCRIQKAWLSMYSSGLGRFSRDEPCWIQVNPSERPDSSSV